MDKSNIRVEEVNDKWVAYSADFPGHLSYGDNAEIAIKSLKDSILKHLNAIKEDLQDISDF